MVNVAYPAAVLEMTEMQAAARTLGLDTMSDDLPKAVREFGRDGAPHQGPHRVKTGACVSHGGRHALPQELRKFCCGAETL